MLRVTSGPIGRDRSHVRPPTMWPCQEFFDGSITMNDVLNFETVWSDGTRAMARISLAG